MIWSSMKYFVTMKTTVVYESRLIRQYNFIDVCYMYRDFLIQ